MTHVERLIVPPAPDLAGSVDTVQRRITGDALWLFSGYAVTAGSGFVFWILAAIWIPRVELGVSASILSIVMAAAALASNGPGSSLVVMLPFGGPAARTILVRGYAATAGLAAALGLIGGVFVASLLPTETPAPTIIVSTAVFTIIWALFNTQTLALAGAGDARSTLLINGTANIAKLALLSGFVLLAVRVPHLLVVATLLPAAAAVTVSMALLVPRALRRQDSAAPSARRWDRGLARTFRVFSIQNTVAVGVVLSVGLSLSFAVTILSSPSEGAVFAIAFQFGAALDLLGVGVATSLARSATTRFEASAGLARGYAWKIVLCVFVLGTIVTLIAPVMFSLLGRDYEPLYGMAVVGALAAASAIRPGYDLWSALSRARHRVVPVLVGNAIYVAVLLILVFALVPRLGALGAATAVACGAVALAVIGAVGLHRFARSSSPTPAEGIAA